MQAEKVRVNGRYRLWEPGQYHERKVMVVDPKRNGSDYRVRLYKGQSLQNQLSFESLNDLRAHFENYEIRPMN